MRNCRMLLAMVRIAAFFILDLALSSPLHKLYAWPLANAKNPSPRKRIQKHQRHDRTIRRKRGWDDYSPISDPWDPPDISEERILESIDATNGQYRATRMYPNGKVVFLELPMPQGRQARIQAWRDEYPLTAGSYSKGRDGQYWMPNSMMPKVVDYARQRGLLLHDHSGVSAMASDASASPFSGFDIQKELENTSNDDWRAFEDDINRILGACDPRSSNNHPLCPSAGSSNTWIPYTEAGMRASASADSHPWSVQNYGMNRERSRAIPGYNGDVLLAPKEALSASYSQQVRIEFERRPSVIAKVASTGKYVVERSGGKGELRFVEFPGLSGSTIGPTYRTDAMMPVQPARETATRSRGKDRCDARQCVTTRHSEFKV